MKLQIVIATGVPTPPEMSKFFKLMAFNPNEGQLAAWLFKLPELKLPSTRPAHAMFMRSYARVTPPIVDPSSVFPVPADLKLVRDYYAAKKVLAPQLAKVMPFLYWMCEKIVDTSPIFRAHFGDVKMRNALLFFILTGQMARRAPPAAAALFSHLEATSLEFNPKSLDEVSLADLQSKNYNEVQVAQTLAKLTRAWFADQVDVKAELRKDIADRVRTLTDASKDKREVWPGNRVYVRNNFRVSVDGVPATLTEAIAAVKRNMHVVSYVNSVSLGDRENDHESDQRLDPIRESSLVGRDSPFTWISKGQVAKFQKQYPDIAALCVLVTPTLTSAINEFMSTGHRAQKSATKALREKHDPLFASLDSLHKQAWMSKYVSQKVLQVSKLPAAETAHTWMRINALKKGELEKVLTTETLMLNLDDVDNLSVDVFKRIISIVGAEKSITTIFKNVLGESIFKRKFLTALIQANALLESPFGKIQAGHVAKNMTASGSDDALLSEKSVEKWNPTRESLKDILSKLTRKVASLPEVTDKDSIKATQEHLQQFIWGGHSTDFQLVREWDVPVSAVQASHLKAAQADKDAWVIRDAFHGTSTSAAGAILMSGFRMSSSFIKTAQSMGPVLYMAPNIDKALQYIGASFGRGRAYGIIFHGDMIVHGKTPPVQARDLRGKTDWTKIDFATEEIGLLHPNAQFIVRKAYLVERQHNTRQKAIDGKNLFQKPIPASSYSVTGKVVASKSASITHDFKSDQRVVVREGPDAWFVGTITAVGKTQIKVVFDDDATATIKRIDFGEVRTITLNKTRPEQLTDKQAKALKSAT